MSGKCDIGLVGLAVMGQNLVLNMESHGFQVAVFNRTTTVTEQFVAKHPDKRIVGCSTLQELVEQLARPRKVMLMIKAGRPVDDLLKQLMPLLEPGDIIIDGGNSHFADTQRRCQQAEAQELLYVGMGVSGGEEGALKGPALMPGGSEAAWEPIRPIFTAIAAKVGPNHDIPCCDWIGPDGAGHYVKMVHNGIEYGDMQLICEAYFLMKHLLGLSNDELYEVFDQWNRGELNSYLIEITRDIFSVKDPETGQYLVDLILDTAGAKGTGKWMSQHALDLGVPSTLVTEAVYARSLSAMKEARIRASRVLPGPEAPEPLSGARQEAVEQIRQALYASKIVSYAQGFVQLRAASKEFQWDLNYGRIAQIWRGGCIIRAQFLDRIKEAFDQNKDLENLLLAPYFRESVARGQKAWRRVVCLAAEAGLPVPAFATALAYYDGYRQERLPANLLQAQRDYFGAHTYRRVDRPGTFHTDWLRLRRQVPPE